MTSRILVIKHGALGDFALALGPARAIRDHHAPAHVTLLTTTPMRELAQASGLFDEIWIDDRPAWWNLLAGRRMIARLRQARFDRVYDLQTSGRSSRYFTLMPPPRPEWSGIARGCSHPDPDPLRDTLHTVERQKGQLRAAGIADVPPADLAFANADLSALGLPPRYAMLVPGGSAHRLDKRWPVERFAALAAWLDERGLAPVVVGAASERALAAAIPRALDLTGRTDLVGLATIARRAALAIGNDTGPMHLAALGGAPSVVLFSAASDPALCAPRGRAVAILRRGSLDELPVMAVMDAAGQLVPALADDPIGDPAAARRPA
ncbi:glycosyltransferase family 9 protein [Zavarzinia sp. CC-PAN008]|uniref:glycosyltransferase family 9 protein n=1 Tax=Zavarzinia sp. CC-PAN008 TaxID=3243332 RepID=UPI003F746A02